ncbi:MAG: pyridoxamine-phosphate oxidase [Proteobacteria bacterium]|nr:pyridoxamine-phosphate oxidase [Pseudomonadota bacterium]
MKKKTGKWETLEGILNEVWSMLEHGATDFNDPFHWPVLGTVGRDGCQQRSVVFRQLIMPARILVCHTDARARKAKEIRDFERTGWHFYHPKKKVQLRLAGQAELHTDDAFVDDQWAKAGITTRLNYCATDPPGTPIDKPSSGLPDLLRNKIPTLLDTEKGRENFMSITCRIDSIDWLVLSVLGNRRARFDWQENNLNSTWLVP